MARVLIVEDDPLVRSAMVADLTERAHAVRTAGTAIDGIREVSQHPPEVIVLDLGLPDLDGLGTLKMMRAVTGTPLIVATARDEEAEIIRLLNAGADDYLVKPFSGEHLAARIAALLRRTGPASTATVISAAGLRIDLARREVLLDGAPLELSRREFDLLAYLATRPGVVIRGRNCGRHPGVLRDGERPGQQRPAHFPGGRLLRPPVRRRHLQRRLRAVRPGRDEP
jgi:DNA-binding response OmpR family regulator